MAESSRRRTARLGTDKPRNEPLLDGGPRGPSDEIAVVFAGLDGRASRSDDAGDHGPEQRRDHAHSSARSLRIRFPGILYAGVGTTTVAACSSAQQA